MKTRPPNTQVVWWEVYRSGPTKDLRTVEQEHVRQVYQNTKKYMIGSGYSIPIGFGHGDTSEEIKGEVTDVKLYKVGGGNYSIWAQVYLFADAYKKYAEGRFPGQSAVIANHGALADGTKFGLHIMGVDLIGKSTAAMPELKRMEFANVFAEKNGSAKILRFSVVNENPQDAAQARVIAFSKEQFDERTANLWLKAQHKTSYLTKETPQLFCCYVAKETYALDQNDTSIAAAIASMSGGGVSKHVIELENGVKIVVGKPKPKAPAQGQIKVKENYDMDKLAAIEEIATQLLAMIQEAKADYGDAKGEPVPDEALADAAVPKEKPDEKQKMSVEMKAKDDKIKALESYATESMFSDLTKSGKIKADQKPAFVKQVEKFGLEQVRETYSLVTGVTPPPGDSIAKSVVPLDTGLSADSLMLLKANGFNDTQIQEAINGRVN